MWQEIRNERYTARRLVYSHAVALTRQHDLCSHFPLLTAHHGPVLSSRSLFFFPTDYTVAHVLYPGSIRTATKRAGGTVRNHGGSPGKRLGLKKFSGKGSSSGGCLSC